MDAIIAFAVVMAILALGDFISTKTHAYFSFILTVLLVFMIGFWTNVIPKNIVETAAMNKISSLCVILLVADIGSRIDLGQLKREWRTVVVSLAALVTLMIVMLTIGTLLLGKTYALASAGPLAGGLVATLMVAERATELGVPQIGVFAALVCAMQNFIGIPITSYFLNKEARHVLKDPNFISQQLALKKAEEENKSIKKSGFKFPFNKKLQTTYILVFKVALVAAISYFLGQYTKAWFNIHPNILLLILGTLAHHFGFFEDEILTKANAAGFVGIAIATILPCLIMDTTPGEVLGMLGSLILCLILGAIGMVIGAIIMGKFVGYSPRISIAIGLTCMYGFPSSFIIANEVAQVNGSTDEEREALLTYIMPKTVLGGFVTVTMVSVIIAGFLVPLIV